MSAKHEKQSTVFTSISAFLTFILELSGQDCLSVLHHPLRSLRSFYLCSCIIGILSSWEFHFAWLKCERTILQNANAWDMLYMFNKKFLHINDIVSRMTFFYCISKSRLSCLSFKIRFRGNQACMTLSFRAVSEGDWLPNTVQSFTERGTSIGMAIAIWTCRWL